MNQNTVTVRNWAIAITLGVALIVLFIILNLLRDYLWPEVYEAPEFIYERIKPIGEVNVGPITEVVTQTAPTPKSGKEIFETVCTACHSTGVLGAPKYGDKASWEPRIAKGEAVLLQSALNGFNQMPARGGQPNLSDDEIKSTVEYMLAAVGVSSNANAETTSASETTGESSPSPKSESGEITNAPEKQPEASAAETSSSSATTDETTDESSPSPQPEETTNASEEKQSALPGTSLLASSSGAPKSTVPISTGEIPPKKKRT